MSTGKIAWTDGIKIAWEVIALLDDVSERAAVAGSLRRGKSIVGDIEIVAMPGEANVKAFEMRCEQLLKRGLFTLRTNKLGNRIAWSDRYRAVSFRGLPLDLFIVQPDRQWGPTFLIRTGPGEANEVLVTRSGIRNRNGHIGILPPDMLFDEGRVWRDGVALDTPEEWHVFKACGLPWISPAWRSMDLYQAWQGRGARMITGDDEPRDTNYVKFDGRWHHMDAVALMASRPDLVTLVELMRTEAVAELVEQVRLW